MSNGKKTRLSSWRKVGAAVAIAVCTSLSTHSARACWFDPIIFDPQSLTEHIQQAASLVQQVTSAATYIQNQLKELGKLGQAVSPQVNVTALTQAMNPNTYGAKDATAQVTTQFPTSPAALSPAQVDALRQQWNQEERAALVEDRQLQNDVYQEMNTTKGQVQAVVVASNNAPGETATIQAHNDLLAVLSEELNAYQALKVSRAGLKAEALARQQSESAYHQAQAAAVMKDFYTPPRGTSQVSGYFSNQ
jgi:conjugal transfer/entry exclusion protein